jgi:hypothetical protein
MDEPIQLGRYGAAIRAGARAVERLQCEFVERHCILLPRLIDPEILEVLQEQISHAKFVKYETEHIGTETWVPSSTCVSTLDFLANTPAFVGFVRQITDCDPIGFFSGRIYRIAPTNDQHLDWHTDIIAEDPRLLTLSLNLSPEPYVGGETQIREKATGRIACQIANTGPGDAIIFRVSPKLEHQVTPVLGTAPRTAYAGWFRPPVDETHRDFHSAVRRPQSIVPHTTTTRK